MTANPIKRQRMEALEDVLEIEYAKLGEFQRVLAISASAPEKFQLRETIKREVLPDIRKYEMEYAALLADHTDLDSVAPAEAENVAAELVQAVKHVQSLPDPNRPEEISRLLVDIQRKLDEPGKVAAAKLKVSLPIIPLIASYEMEIDTEGMLVTAWRRVKSLFGGKA